MKTIALLLCTCLILSLTPISSAAEDTQDKEAILSTLYESDISTAREALDQGLITCVELTRYFLERIEAYNDTFNCFITLCDNALEEAEKRDLRMTEEEEHSILLGIPIVVKDNMDYEGYPTTNGLWTYGSVAWESATVVQTLIDAGAVVLGKSNMATEAQEAQFTASDAVGETFNAYGVHLSAGGSSGGSAAAVSLNFCYGGLGTDTNASLRYPAVLNGCISMRSTKGLLDRKGIIILNGTRDVPGVITRSVKDQALILGEMAGVDYISGLNANALCGKRIGILQELCYCDTAYAYRSVSKIDEEIKSAFYEDVDNFRSLGATVITVSIPNLYSLAESCEYNSSYAIEKYLKVYDELFASRDLDAVIFPTYLHTPDYCLAEKGWDNLNYDTFYSNCSLLSSPLGVPEIAIPIGYHSIGSGIGLEIAALRGEDALVLDLAYSYTEAYNTRIAPTLAPDLYLNSPVPSEPETEGEETTDMERATEPETITEDTTEETVQPTESVPNPKRSITREEIRVLLLLFVLGIIFAVSVTVKQIRRKKPVHK